jgi:hypothetical protein
VRRIRVSYLRDRSPPQAVGGRDDLARPPLLHEILAQFRLEDHDDSAASARRVALFGGEADLDLLLGKRDGLAVHGDGARAGLLERTEQLDDVRRRERPFHFLHARPEPRADQLEVGLELVDDVLLRLFREPHALHVQLVLHERQHLGEGSLERRIREHDDGLVERLSDSEPCCGAGGPTKADDLEDDGHAPRQAVINEPLVAGRVVLEVDAFLGSRHHAHGEAPVHVLREEGHERGCKPRERREALVKRRVRAPLVRPQAAGPESRTARAHVPVRQPLDEVEQGTGRGEDVE